MSSCRIGYEKNKNNLKGSVFVEDRKLVFKSLVGSQNYNLATPRSDKDYKAFVYPTLNDLYEGKFVKKAVVTDNEDTEYHDIRKLPVLLSKSNVNFVEVLFTEEVTSRDELHKEFYNLRNDIAKMNLSYLFDASMGMFNNEVKLYKKKMEVGQELQAYKYAASAIRITDFLIRFFNTDFNDFKQAIWYEDDSVRRDFILTVKRGESTIKDVNHALRVQEREAVLLKEDYKSRKKDRELENHIQELVKNHTLDHLLGGKNK